jgi:hypothetical protein
VVMTAEVEAEAEASKGEVSVGSTCPLDAILFSLSRYCYCKVISHILQTSCR